MCVGCGNCSVLGTGVMVAGLYFFLWGKLKTKQMNKSSSSHLPRSVGTTAAVAVAVEANTATSEPAFMQSDAAVVPATSPTNDNNDIIPIVAAATTLDLEQAGCNTNNTTI